MGPGVGDKCVYCPKIETLEHLFVKFFRLGFHLMYLFMAQNIEHKRKMKNLHTFYLGLQS